MSGQSQSSKRPPEGGWNTCRLCDHWIPQERLDDGTGRFRYECSKHGTPPYWFIEMNQCGDYIYGDVPF